MEESLTRAKRYSRNKTRLAVAQLGLTVVFLLLLLLSGMSLRLKESVAGSSHNFYIQVGLYLVILSCAHYLLFLGLDFYGGFLLEHKFLLSNQTLMGWLQKSIKKWLLSLLLLVAAGESLYFFLRHFPNHWWLLTASAWLLLTVVLGRIAPSLIIPLFYKCTPLADRELKEKLLKLCNNCAVDIQQVFEIHLSKDTQKANAAVAGLGKGRRILLGDTLLNNYSHEEVEAVFAHELGHVRLSHPWKILAFATVISIATFYLTGSLFKTSLSPFAFEQVWDVAAFPLLALIIMLTGLLFVPIQNAFLRYLEKRADIFAMEHIENPQSFVSAMKKLADQNLVDPSPGRLEVLFLHDHPPLSERLRYAAAQKSS